MHYHRWQRHGNPLKLGTKLGVRTATPQASMRKPLATDLHWAAGFLEGEGWFSRSGTGSEVVGAKQVQREPLDRLVAMFGGKIGLREQWAGGGVKSRQPIHTWQIHGGRARGVMMTLFSMLSPKRRTEIQEAMAYAGKAL